MKNLPSFSDFHPFPAVPLFLLGQITDNKTALNQICGYDFEGAAQLKEYTKKEVFDEEYWIDLTSPPRISGIDVREFDILKRSSNNELIYSAKYRLIMSNEAVGVEIRVIS